MLCLALRQPPEGEIEEQLGGPAGILPTSLLPVPCFSVRKPEPGQPRSPSNIQEVLRSPGGRLRDGFQAHSFAFRESVKAPGRRRKPAAEPCSKNFGTLASSRTWTPAKPPRPSASSTSVAP